MAEASKSKAEGSAPPVNPLSAFPGASHQSPGLRRLIETAGDLYSRSSRELVMDVESVVAAAFLVGARTRSNLNSARWFFEALQPSNEYVGERRRLREKQAKERGHLEEQGFKPTPSRSLRDTVLPRAREFARLTIANEEYAQRHVLMSLLFLPPERWPQIGPPVDAALLKEARRHLVEEIGRNPEKGESMEAWRKIIDGSDALPPPPLSPLPGSNDHLRAHRDDPAQEDRLGRKYFAEVIADRIREVRRSQQPLRDKAARGTDRAFMVNLDGAWGAGKSSVLNFVEEELRKPKPDAGVADPSGSDEAWLVVHFNAWRSHHLEPPWWSIVRQMAGQLPGQLGGAARMRFRLVWWWWKLRNDYAPLLLASLLVTVGLTVFLMAPTLRSGKGFFGDTATFAGIIGLLTAIGGLAGAGRNIFFGSEVTARKMEALRDDPLAPAMDLFAGLVAAAGRPILIIIDDIDRCRDDYVVDLLESVQTLLREAPITYLVAGDRHWITTSFEERYQKFGEKLGSAARPLGHLFLDKVFQLSVSIPEFSRSLKRSFWQGVLQKADQDVRAGEKAVEGQRETARAIVAGKQTERELEQARDEAENPALKQAISVEAARRAASAEFASSLEHRYADYGDLLDSNPRAIKRLVNKLGMNQSMMLLAEREIAPGPLARWTVIELRWPLLADRLQRNPGLLQADLEEALGELLEPEAKMVLGDTLADGLTTSALCHILGVDEPSPAARTAATARS